MNNYEPVHLYIAKGKEYNKSLVDLYTTVLPRFNTALVDLSYALTALRDSSMDACGAPSIANILQHLNNDATRNVVDYDLINNMLHIGVSNQAVSFLKGVLLAKGNFTSQDTSITRAYITEVTFYNEVLLEGGYFNRLGISFTVHPDYSRGITAINKEHNSKLVTGEYNAPNDASVISTFDPVALNDICAKFVNSGAAKTAMLRTLCSLLIYDYESYGRQKRNTGNTITPSNAKDVFSGTMRLSSYSDMRYLVHSSTPELPVAYTSEYQKSTVEEVSALLALMYVYPDDYIRNSIVTTYDNGNYKLKLPEEVAQDVTAYYLKNWRSL